MPTWILIRVQKCAPLTSALLVRAVELRRNQWVVEFWKILHQFLPLQHCLFAPWLFEMLESCSCLVGRVVVHQTEIVRDGRWANDVCHEDNLVVWPEVSMGKENPREVVVKPFGKLWILIPSMHISYVI